MSLPATPMPGVSPRPEPFAPKADPAALEDLRARLRATRWPDAPEDAGWSIGADLDYLRELVAYWADEFDWTAQEQALARLPRYRVRLGDYRIHYVHARAAAPASSPPDPPQTATRATGRCGSPAARTPERVAGSATATASGGGPTGRSE